MPLACYFVVVCVGLLVRWFVLACYCDALRRPAIVAERAQPAQQLKRTGCGQQCTCKAICTGLAGVRAAASFAAHVLASNCRCPLLQKFYSDPDRYAYSFQHYVLLSRVQEVGGRHVQ